MKQGAIFIFTFLIAYQVQSQNTFPLYPGGIPHARVAPDREVSEVREGITRVSNISRPTITVFQAPEKIATGTAVIIFPGGGYWINAISHEGTDVAKVFNTWGVTAFVVKYRIPDDSTMENRETGPLQDAQQAITLVRSRAAEWKVDPARIGIMGFSAGGHLASTAGTHFDRPVLENNPVSLRPDFMILIYPVISFQDSIGHMGSREQLLGKLPLSEKVNYYSNERQVTSQTPPTFLVHAADDDVVKVENSLLFYQALVAHQVPAELHAYPHGGHGFGMNNRTTPDPWMDRCRNWMKSMGWIK